MESTPENASQTNQAEAKPNKDAQIFTEKADSPEAAPPSDSTCGIGNQQPPEIILPPKPWYTRVSLTDWITAISAAITAFATVIIMMWAGLQWHEMHTGGVDTHALAEAAHQQASAASSFAQSASRINDGIEEAVKKLDAQATATQRAAQAARSAADTASAQLVLSERPWLRIKHRIVNPLTFNVDTYNGPTAIVTLEDTIENIGQSVAVNVLHWEDIVPLDPDTWGTETARARQKQYCDTNRHPAKQGLQGFTMFPHDPSVSNSTVGVAMDKVRAAELHDRPSRPSIRIPPNSSLDGTVGFVIVGCVFYRASFEPEDRPTHQTRFMYRLAVPHGEMTFYPWVSPVGVASSLQLLAIPDGFTTD